ncbi:MAG: ABC transporter ATP-binding protein [Peptococcaceae bacterium]
MGHFENYLEVKSLQVEYLQQDNSFIALQSADLTLEKGKIGVLIGPSGSGKSTLLHVLAGLKNEFGGQVLVKGGPASVTNKGTALILQDYGLLPWKTVWHNTALGLEIRKFNSGDIRNHVEKILNKLGILALAGRYPVQLSGGQRQRVAIARALALEPELLLMDEPFSSLDALTREELQDLLLQIWQETRMTILLVTHGIEEAVFLGQKIFVMSSAPGRIIKTVDNKLAGDINSRGKQEYYELCSRLRSLLRGGDQTAEDR